MEDYAAALPLSEEAVALARRTLGAEHEVTLALTLTLTLTLTRPRLLSPLARWRALLRRPGPG